MSQLSRIPGVRSNLGLAARAPGWRGGTDRAQAVASGTRSPEIRGLRSPHLHRFPSQTLGAEAAGQTLPKKLPLMGRGHARHAVTVRGLPREAPRWLGPPL